MIYTSALCASGNGETDRWTRCRRSDPALTARVKQAKRLYGHIWRAARALSSTFSLVVLVYSLVLLATTTAALYVIVLSVTDPSPALLETRSYFFAQLSSSLLRLAFYLTAADIPSQRVSANPTTASSVG